MNSSGTTSTSYTGGQTGSQSGSQSVIDVLQDLSARAHDSELGYRRSAEDASDPDLKRQFEQLANERASMAAELDRLIREQGGEPKWQQGSTLGAVHRMFVDLKTAMSANEREAIISEIARGESAAEEAYDEALRANLPENVRKVVRDQHRRVRETRNRYRAMSNTSGTRRSGEMAHRMTAGGGAGVTHYMADRPVMSGAVVFAIGFAVGALMVSMMSSSSGGRSYDQNDGGSQRRW